MLCVGESTIRPPVKLSTSAFALPEPRTLPMSAPADLRDRGRPAFAGDIDRRRRARDRARVGDAARYGGATRERDADSRLAGGRDRAAIGDAAGDRAAENVALRNLGQRRCRRHERPGQPRRSCRCSRHHPRPRCSATWPVRVPLVIRMPSARDGEATRRKMRARSGRAANLALGPLRVEEMSAFIPLLDSSRGGASS